MTSAVRYLEQTGRRLFRRGCHASTVEPVAVVPLLRSEGGAVETDMPESRNTHVHRIRDRIARDEYSVDADAVAEAIVARLVAASQASRDASASA